MCVVCVPRVPVGHTVHDLVGCSCVSARGVGVRLGLIHFVIDVFCPYMTATLPAPVCAVAQQPVSSGSIFAICAAACWMTCFSFCFFCCSGVIQKVTCATVDVFTIKVRIRCRWCASVVEQPPSIPQVLGTIPSRDQKRNKVLFAEWLGGPLK